MRGCIMPAHWMQRDAYDTGKRNHLQQHSEVDNKRFKIREEQRKSALCANSLVVDKGFAYFSAVGAEAATMPSIQTLQGGDMLPASHAEANSSHSSNFLVAPISHRSNCMVAPVLLGNSPVDRHPSVGHASKTALLKADSSEYVCNPCNSAHTALSHASSATPLALAAPLASSALNDAGLGGAACLSVSVFVCVCLPICLPVRERGRESESESERASER